MCKLRFTLAKQMIKIIKQDIPEQIVHDKYM